MRPSTRPVTRRVALAALASGVAIPATAHAYLQPNARVLERAGRRRSTAELQVALVGRARTATGVVPIGERWIFSGRHVQTDVNGPDGRRASWRRGSAPEGDVALLPGEVARALFGRLFADRDVAALARDLHIDPDESHLDLVGDRVAHVVGASLAQRRDRAIAALWVDQETFDVLRVRVPGRPGLDARLSEWGGPPTRGMFPQKVHITLGGRWVRRLEVDRVQTSEPGGE